MRQEEPKAGQFIVVTSREWRRRFTEICPTVIGESSRKLLETTQINNSARQRHRNVLGSCGGIGRSRYAMIPWAFTHETTY